MYLLGLAHEKKREFDDKPEYRFLIKGIPLPLELGTPRYHGTRAGYIRTLRMDDEMSYFYDSMSKRGEPIHGHISKEDETASAGLLDIPGSRGQTPVHAQHCSTKHTPPPASSVSCFCDN